MTCSNCNQALPEGARFCGNCGAAVPATTSTVPAPATTPVNTTPTPFSAPTATPFPADHMLTEHAHPDQPAAPSATAAPTYEAPQSPVSGPIVSTSYESPASIGQNGPGPIIQSSSSKTPLIVIAVFAVLALIIGGAWFAGRALKSSIEKQQNSSSTTMSADAASNECYSTSLPESLKVNKGGSACSIDANDAKYTTHVNIDLLQPSITEASLQQFAVKDIMARSHQTDTPTPTAAQFGGQPAYQYDTKSASGRNYSYVYVYDKQSLVIGSKNTAYHAYVIEVMHPTDSKALVGSISENWKWKARDTPVELAGSLPVADGTTDCFSFTGPADTQYSGDVSTCAMYADYGSANKNSRLRVWTSIKPQGDLKSLVADWKASETKVGNTVISESAIKVGGLDGVKIIYHLPRSTSDRVEVLVYTGAKHKIGGYYVDSFEIDANYADPAEKQAVDGMIASWKWL